MRVGDRRKTLITTLVMAVMIAVPGVAQAGDTKDQATEEETTTTSVPEPEVAEVVQSLPVLGSGMSVTITRGEDGAIASVGLDDAGATTVKETDHKVVFLLSDGSTEVVVKSKGGFVQTKVKAEATADVTGPGSWAADVFGNGIVTIPYDVSFDGNNPNITIGTIGLPSGVTAEIGEPKTRTSDDGNKSSFKVKVRLTSGEETAKVSFIAKVRINDEGEVKVALAVTLSSHDRVKCWDGDDRNRDRWDKDDGDSERADRNRDDDDGNRRDDRDRDRDGRDGDRDRDGRDGDGGRGDGHNGDRDGDGDGDGGDN